MNEDDKRDLTKHGARETLLTQYARTFGLSRKQAMEEFVCHAENDEESAVFCVAGGKPRKRSRRTQAEANADG